MIVSPKNWRDVLLQPENRIEDAVKTLNNIALKIVIICETSGRLIGTVSDGDIRRGLLRGLSLSDDISEVVNTKPIFARASAPEEEIYIMMKTHNVFQIPIVNHFGSVEGLLVWDFVEQNKRRENQFVIMAGGKGSRLMPLTRNVPKPMLPVAGMPILEHIVKRASSEGFYNFIFAVNYLREKIEKHFKDGSAFGVEIMYIKEETPLGTAGALSLINPIPEHPIVVSNGDLLTDVSYGDLIDYHDYHESSATMVVQRHELQNPFGVVETEGNKILNYFEKPLIRSLINAGVYVLDYKVISLLEKGVPCDMPTLFNTARARGLRTIVYPLHESWIDVGNQHDYKIAARAAAENVRREPNGY